MLSTALKFMRYDLAKSVGIIIGIVISIFLIGQQIGILGFLTGLMGGLVENARQDIGQIWVVDNITSNVNELAQLDQRLVSEIKSIDGVANTFPIVAANAAVRFRDGKSASVLIIGSEAPVFVAGPAKEKINAGSIMALTLDGAVSAELYDKSTFNNAVDLGTRVEINGRAASIRLQTKNARGFSGSFFYTTLSRAKYFTRFPENKVSAIAVQIKPGYEIRTVVDGINKTIFGVRAWDAQELKKSTIRFITVSSNIGTSVGSLVVFAIISGFFIIGLTLYSSALDRIKDYGTLKAIGATNRYVSKLILTQSFLFAIAGFLLALLLLEAFRRGVASSGLIFHYALFELAGLFLVTVFISVGGSWFAIRKINHVEPASVFRG